MKLLAIDTATEACSAALLLGETILTRYEEPRRGHAELILPMIDDLLAEGGVSLKQLDCIAVGRGPGAFTGVRIAVTVAQGLAFGADLQIVPVSDLAALAQRAAEAGQPGGIVACIDARMSEVYWAIFDVGSDGLVAALTLEQVSAPDRVEAPSSGPWVGAGTGWSAHPHMADRLRSSGWAAAQIYPSLLPRAHEVARLAVRDWRSGEAVSPEKALPVYLRDRVTHPMSQKT